MVRRTKPIDIAVRAYPDVPTRAASTRRRWTRPDWMLVLDTETTTDTSQRFTFGSYRVYEGSTCIEEGLIVADDLPRGDRRTIARYAARRRAATSERDPLLVLTLDQFLERFFRVVYRGRALCVAFNMPFDLSRLARWATEARGQYQGGFSFGFWLAMRRNGSYGHSLHRPRIRVKHIDSKRALIGFGGRAMPDDVDRIPDGADDPTPQEGYVFPGHFLDLRRLAFALTDRGHSLKSACEAFQVRKRKLTDVTHGRITPLYIDYNRRDVEVTAALARKLLAEFERHPIALPPTKAYSPASIGKAQLEAMGIPPVLERQPDFPLEYLGYAQSAFYGGRTSAHIRKVVVPVVYTDFLSMYPTVNALMNLWSFVRAESIDVIPNCAEEIRRFLEGVTLDACFDPTFWPQLTAFVRVLPQGDFLPCRGQFNSATKDWQVAMAYLTAESPDDALWYALPDVVASVLRTGRVPVIADAFRLQARGMLPSLVPTRLRGCIDVDPRTTDFFRTVVEERTRLKARTDVESKRTRKALKVLVNATSFGIFGEMVREDSAVEVKVRCRGVDRDPFTCRVRHPERPGRYCFPPLAALITSGARLQLALLDEVIRRLGGTYAMEDTDSMAIVATELGGLIACPGGDLRLPNGAEAVRALSWEDVRGIQRRFAALNPYDKRAVPGSVVKIEADNFLPKTKEQRPIECLAISAKRYTLLERDRRGEPVLLLRQHPDDKDRWSEHGLGHLLNPSDPNNEARDWIAAIWIGIVRRALGLATSPLPFEDRPAVGKMGVTSPTLMRAFDSFNAGKSYAESIKPFSFGLSCRVRKLGHPIGVDLARFHLFAPFEKDWSLWQSMKWVDRDSGKTFRIDTHGASGTRTAARVATYGEVVVDYEFSPEAKAADINGRPAERQTVGLLQPRHVVIGRARYIGKESNVLEEVDEGLIHDAADAYTEYVDPRRDEWNSRIRPALRDVTLTQLIEKTGLSRRALIDARTGKRRPRPGHRRVLAAIARRGSG